MEFIDHVKLVDPLSNMSYPGTKDMDGDGDPDIFAISDYGLGFDWWENDGEGNFQRHQRSVDDSLLPVQQIGDWNADGRQDLFLSTGNLSEVTFLVALGNASGSFDNPVQVLEVPKNPSFHRNFLFSDLNQDGSMDLIFTDKVFMGKTGGGFETAVPFPAISSSQNWREDKDVTLFDYDGDGDLDLFTKDQNLSRIVLFHNGGNGNFFAPVFLLTVLSGENMSGFCFVDSHIAGAPAILVVHSNDAESKDRLRSYSVSQAGVATPTGEQVLPGDDAGEPLYWYFPHQDGESGRAFISAIRDNRWTRLVELQSGAGGIALSILKEHPDVTPYGFTEILDLDGDGTDDLLVPIPQSGGDTRTATDSIVWYPGLAAGGFREMENNIAAPEYGRYPCIVDDLDGDGDNDLVLGNRTPFGGFLDKESLTVWSNHGDGIGFTKTEVPVPGSNPLVLAIFDFEAEILSEANPRPDLPFDLPAGKKDLVVRSNFPSAEFSVAYLQTHLVYQDRNGQFSVKHLASFPADWQVFFEDWDGDGMPDLMTYGSNGILGWKKRDGDRFGAWREIMSFPTTFGGYGFAGARGFLLLDMDGDGDLDVYGKGSLFGPDSSYWAERDTAGEIVAYHRISSDLSFADLDADGDGLLEASALFGDYTGLNPAVDFRFDSGSVFFPSLTRGYFDLDGDGDIDRIHSAPTLGTLGFQRLLWSENLGGNGDPVFSEPVEFAGVEVSQRGQFALKDMDGDGTKDLIVLSSDTARLEWFKIANRMGPLPFTMWMAEQSLTGSSAGPRGDLDKDGRSNWEEFLFGTKANIPDSGNGFLPHLERSANAMEFTFARRKSGGGLNLTFPMQRSITLDGDWEPWNPGTFPTTDLGDYEEIRIPVTPGDGAEFFRVKLPEIPE